jgi:hypothetical protein
MDLLLAFGPALLGGGGLALLIAGGAFLLGGWPLLLNRKVLLAIAVVVAIAAAAAWWEGEKASLRAEGAAAEHVRQERINKLARDKRQADISDFVVDSTKRELELRGRLQLSEQRLDRALAERISHVSTAADSRCVVPYGFVRDHDTDLSRATGRAAILIGSTDFERASGIPLSRVGAEIGHNYAQLGKCLARLSAAEERRYTACIEWDRKWGTESHCTRGGPPEAAGEPQGAAGGS